MLRIWDHNIGNYSARGTVAGEARAMNPPPAGQAEDVQAPGVELGCGVRGILESRTQIEVPCLVHIYPLSATTLPIHPLTGHRVRPKTLSGVQLLQTTQPVCQSFWVGLGWVEPSAKQGRGCAAQRAAEPLEPGNLSFFAALFQVGGCCSPS